MEIVGSEEIPTPALLRAAWMTYGARMRGALALADFDDIPRNGLYVIGALARGQTALADIVQALRVSKQAAGQLVDTLVLRGYLARTVDAADRRRLTVTLTERGQAAALIQRGASESLDAQLLDCVGAERFAQLREALVALVQLGEEERQE